MNRRRPSITSLVAFFLIVSPLVYVLSFAPVVRICGQRSLYPAYKPVNWMIDHTALREPLFIWAGIWGVRDEVEANSIARIIFDMAPEEATGSTTPIQAWSGPP